MAPVGSAGFHLLEGEGEGGADIRRVWRYQPLGSRLLDTILTCQESLNFFAMAWTMEPVGSASFRLWKGGGEEGANL